MNPQAAQRIWYIPRKKDIFSKPDDVLTAAEKYIEEHGTEAFERLITKVYLMNFQSFDILNKYENLNIL